MEKYCPKCHTKKLINEFSNYKSNKDGKYCYCRVCKSEDDKKYRSELKDKGVYKKKKRESYLKNLEKYKEYTKNRVRDYKKEYATLRESDIRTFKYCLRNRVYQAFKFRNIQIYGIRGGRP